MGCIEQSEMHRTTRARRTTVHIAPLNAPYDCGLIELSNDV
jgi:hypothetical protein